MAYTDIDDPSAYFQTKLYTAADAYTFDGNSDLAPNWMWIKERNGTNEHNLFDSVRGTTIRLESSASAAEQTSSTTLTAFGSDGFTVGNNGGTGQNGGNYVGWGWKAGTSFTNDASATSVGNIDSQGSVNQTAGFSIIKWSGNGSNDQQIAHGLGAAPAWWIVKRRNADVDWYTVHKSTIANYYDDYFLRLNDNTVLEGDNNVGTGVPTSSVFFVGNDTLSNASGGEYIAYLFAEKQGYSKFGSYTGNGNADGTFIYTGFKPAWIMVKNASATQNWLIYDDKISPINAITALNFPNQSSAEDSSAGARMDMLSNGFKLRINHAGENASGNNYIYMAFAEQPFVTSTGVPATAR